MMGFFISCCLLLVPGFVESLGPAPGVPVQRIASLAPSLTQAVLVLGAQEKLVAVSRFDEEASLRQLPRAGGFSDVAAETLLRLRPDVVLVQKAPGNEAALRRLAAQGVSILAFSLTSTKEVCQAMEYLGEVLEAQEKARAWVASFEALRRRLAEAAPQKRPRVLLLVGASPVVAAGPGSFADELIWAAGGQNVVERSLAPFPVLSPERLVRHKPDIVIDLTEGHEGHSTLQKLPGLSKARWVRAPNKDLLQPGPALVGGLLQLHKMIQGGAPPPLGPPGFVEAFLLPCGRWGFLSTPSKVFFRFSPLARESGRGAGGEGVSCRLRRSSPFALAGAACLRRGTFCSHKKFHKNAPSGGPCRGLRHSSYPTDSLSISRAHHSVGLIPCTL